MKDRRDFIKSIGGSMTVGSLLGIKIRDDMSLDEYISRHSARFVLNPHKYVKPEATEDLDILEFSESFVYQPDQIMGAYDTVQDVEKTIEVKNGDCTDYTALATSWILQHKNTNPELLIYIPEDPSLMGHISVADGRYLYNNGEIYNVGQGNYGLQGYNLIYKKEL